MLYSPLHYAPSLLSPSSPVVSPLFAFSAPSLFAFHPDGFDLGAAADAHRGQAQRVFGEPDGDQSTAPERRGRKMAALGKKVASPKDTPCEQHPSCCLQILFTICYLTHRSFVSGEAEVMRNYLKCTLSLTYIKRCILETPHYSSAERAVAFLLTEDALLVTAVCRRV